MHKPVNIEYITAVAQILLSVLFIGGYFTMLAVFLLGYVHVAPVWRDQLSTLIGVLTAGVLLILQFWFSRLRSQSAHAQPKPEAEQ